MTEADRSVAPEAGPVWWDGRRWLTADRRLWWDGRVWRPIQLRYTISRGCGWIVFGAFVILVLAGGAAIVAIAIPQALFEHRCDSAGGNITVASEVNDVINDPLDRVCVVHGKVAFHEHDHR